MIYLHQWTTVISPFHKGFSFAKLEPLWKCLNLQYKWYFCNVFCFAYQFINEAIQISNTDPKQHACLFISFIAYTVGINISFSIFGDHILPMYLYWEKIQNNLIWFDLWAKFGNQSIFFDETFNDYFFTLILFSHMFLLTKGLLLTFEIHPCHLFCLIWFFTSQSTIILFKSP